MQDAVPPAEVATSSAPAGAAVETRDVELLDALRAGDAAAFGELYARHYQVALQAAVRTVRDVATAEDVVADAFTSVLAAVRSGGGPTSNVRAYLLATVRNSAIGALRASSRTRPAPQETLDRPYEEDPAVESEHEHDHVRAAFAALPPRWRRVLWYSDVHDLSPAQVAPLVGSTPNAVSSQLRRARERLRHEYLQHHLRTVEPGCAPYASRLGGYVRDALGRRAREEVGAHLDGCVACTAAVEELRDVNGRIRTVLLPLGLVGASAGVGATVTGAGAVTGVRARRAVRRRGTDATRRPPGARAGARASRGAARPGAVTRVTTALGAHGAAGVLVGVGVVVCLAAAAAVVAANVGTGSADGVVAGGEHRAAGPSGGTHDLGRGSDADADDTGDAPDQPAAEPGPPAATDEPSPAPAPTPSGPGAAGGKQHPPEPATGGTDLVVGPVRPPAAPFPGDHGSPGTGDGDGDGDGGPPVVVPPAEPPVEPAELDVALLGVGDLVRDRTGVVAISVTNTGARASRELAASVDLPAGVAPVAQEAVRTTALVRGSGVAAGAWDCVTRPPGPAGPATTCTTPGIGPGDTAHLLLPVEVAEDATLGATGLTVSVTEGTVTVAEHHEQVQVRADGLSVRHVATGAVDVTTIGAPVLHCLPTSPRCPDVVAGTATGSTATNNVWQMTPVDELGLGTTSSSAVLELPGDVLAARLYWSGACAGDPGAPLLRAPDGSTSRVGGAVEVDRVGSSYQAGADVTRQVRAGGAGTWSVADVCATPGLGAYGGWALVVVHGTGAGTPTGSGDRLAVVLDGFVRVGSAAPLVVTTTGRPGTRADVGLVAWEGDAGGSGDRLRLGGQALVPLRWDGSGPAGPGRADDALDSTAWGSAYANSLGVDAKRFEPVVLDDAVVRVEATTGSDVYLVGALSVVSGAPAGG